MSPLRKRIGLDVCRCELQRLQQRVNKLAVAKKPPTLRMFVIKGGDRKVPRDESELTQWDLVCKIQEKPFSA